MKSFISKTLAVLTMTLVCSIAHAQFSVTGDEPASARWHKIVTPNFKIVYPGPLDSLARVYGLELEKARPQLEWSSGYLINQKFKARMPVVLHPYQAVANASVVWAPKRMDIYTMADPFEPTATPWVKDLALHEGRHAAQMQFTGDGFLFTLFKIFSGQSLTGLLSAVFPGPALLEGDAVATETALSQSGRGRQAYFLGYMMPSFDNGDWRDYWKWTTSSLNKFTPDYYKGGYMVVAGSRVFFNDPAFMKDYFHSAKNLRICDLQHTFRKASRMKFRQAIRTIEEGFHDIWTEEALARAPFMPMEQVTARPRYHTVYSDMTVTEDGTMFARKSSLDAAGSLTRISPSGQEERIRSFSGNISTLQHDSTSGRIYWSEIIGDRRWSLKGESDIRFISTDEPSKIHTLAAGHRYFNPIPSPDGKVLSVSEYALRGNFNINLIDALSGEITESYPLPDGFQPLESVWIGDRLFFSALSDNGTGIYELTGKDSSGKASMKTLASPVPVSITDLGTWPERHSVTFISDKNGVNEMYCLEADGKSFSQMTSTRYGISNPRFNAAADTLFYTALATDSNPENYKEGYMIYSTAVKDLPMKEASLSDVHRYPVADKLAEQERILAEGRLMPDVQDSDSLFSEPKRYSKVRLPHIHSWAPVFVDYDDVMNISVDEINEIASIGACAYFQNLFSTGYGMIGFNHHRNQYDTEKWKNALHLKYTYTGWYPAFEMNLDAGDRDRMMVQRILAEKDGEKKYYSKGYLYRNTVSVNGSLKVYVPLNFSSGGISKGLIPQAKWTVSNDRYDDLVYVLKYEEPTKEGEEGKYRQVGTLGSGDCSFMNTLQLSVRGYITRGKTESQVYPSLGIGAEAGLRTHPGHAAAYKDAAYLYTYGYLPGLGPFQGLKLTASLEKAMGKAEYSLPSLTLSSAPRGFASSSLSSFLNRNYRTIASFTADYAIPFGAVDWSFLCPVAYIRNFIITPFCDISHNTYGTIKDLNLNVNGFRQETLMSAGADLTAVLGKFLWNPYDTTVGVRYARNFWKNLEAEGVTGLDRNYVSLIFEMDF